MTSGMRFIFAVAVLAGVSLTGCRKQVVEHGGNEHSPVPLPAAAVAAQDELNKYFHDQVMSHVASCWKSVKGTGVVEFKYSFRPVDKQWTSDTVTVEKTTIADDQTVVAMHCMEEAVKGTSVPVSTHLDVAPGLSVYWEWPVPLPDESSTAIALRISTGGGGGDKVCNKCMLEACPEGQCPKRDQCAGRSTCSVTDSGDGTAQCNFSLSDRCVQGHYGLSGNRMFIY